MVGGVVRWLGGGEMVRGSFGGISKGWRSFLLSLD